jgi:hypothetical protein
MDNHHCQVAGSQVSCGLAQVYNLTSDPDKILYALATQLYHPARGQPYAFVMWSDAEASNGVKLAEHIKDQFDGVLTSEWVENPKTSNLICVWLWKIPHADFKYWYIQQRVEKAKQL